jgi:hypothetical protein
MTFKYRPQTSAFNVLTPIFSPGLASFIAFIFALCLSSQSINGNYHKTIAASNSLSASGTAGKFPLALIRRLRGGSTSSQSREWKKLRTATCPDKALALTNHVYLNPSDFQELTAFARGAAPGAEAYVSIGPCVFLARGHDGVEAGTVALSSAQRKSARVSCDEQVAVRSYRLADAGVQIASVELAVDYAGRAAAGAAPVDADALALHLLSRLRGQVR